ncbi:hypothetical protein LTR84_007949 [Exophiala bonariae]|uniref:Uncharacterized protein n=1 Tax=Exophiala bonariae TaxID=1690606 RepID=A0AAV9NQE0_9EURO|nr:hypothetical protein LTR84_007949 [Exophiala bonariae]
MADSKQPLSSASAGTAPKTATITESPSVTHVSSAAPTKKWTNFWLASALPQSALLCAIFGVPRQLYHRALLSRPSLVQDDSNFRGLDTDDEEEDHQELINAPRDIKSLRATLFSQARHYGVTGGKWIVFVSRQNLDKVWSIVAHRTAEGRLGVEATVLTTGKDSGDDIPISIHTSDFVDRGDVVSVLKAIIQAKITQEAEQAQIYYKPDVFSHPGTQLWCHIWTSYQLLGQRQVGKGNQVELRSVSASQTTQNV